MEYPVLSWRKRAPRLSPGEYEAAALAAIAALPPAGEANTASRAGYALARMKTLAKKPHISIPEDEGVMKALWFCFALSAFPNDAKRTRARLLEAAEACISMTHGVPPAQREALRSQCGLAAEAASRLLYHGILISNRKE